MEMGCSSVYWSLDRVTKTRFRLRAVLYKTGLVFSLFLPLLFFFSFVFLALLNLLQPVLVKAVPAIPVQHKQGIHWATHSPAAALVSAVDHSAVETEC